MLSRRALSPCRRSCKRVARSLATVASLPTCIPPAIPQLNYHTYFNYTSGRWLYNEAQQLACRYSPFNIVALHETVHRCTGSRIVHIDKKEGVFNKSFICTLENGSKVVARVKGPIAGPHHLTTASEVATMDFARNVLGVPVPKVLDYNSKAQEHPVQGEFMIMEYSPGVQLSTIWLDLTPTQRKNIVNSLVSIEQRLLEAKFAAYGSLYYKSDIPESMRHPQLYADPSRQSSYANKFCIGPSARMAYYEDERALLDIDRGPWSNTEKYLESIVDREQAWLSKDAKPNIHDDPLRALTGPQNQQEHIDLLEQLRSVLPALVPTDSKVKESILWHPDLNLGNIFVSPDGDHDIVQIIDWQHTCLGPAYLQVTTPAFLRYLSDSGSLLPSGLEFPQLPEDMDKLSQEAQEEAESTYHLKMLQKLYDIKQLYPYRIPKGDTFTHPIYTAGRTWKDGLLPLRLALLNVAIYWDSLSAPNQPCPLTFTRAEIQSLIKDRERWVEWHNLLDFVRSSFGIRHHGWVSTEDYHRKRKLIDSTIPEALRKEAEALLPSGWWPFREAA